MLLVTLLLDAVVYVTLHVITALCRGVGLIACTVRSCMGACVENNTGYTGVAVGSTIIHSLYRIYRPGYMDPYMKRC